MDTISSDSSEKIFFEQGNWLVTDRIVRFGNTVVPLKEIHRVGNQIVPAHRISNILMRVGFWGSAACILLSATLWALPLLPITVLLYLLFLRDGKAVEGQIYAMTDKGRVLLEVIGSKEPQPRYGLILFTPSFYTDRCCDSILTQVLPVVQAISDAIEYRVRRDG